MKLFAVFTVTQCSVMNYRYKDVIDLAKRYWESNGEKFDATKYLAYGCHCMLLGDRPIGKGVPVDRLDKACRALKQCHKCVEAEYDSGCSTVEMSSSIGFSGTNATYNGDDSCLNNMFNCNLQFVTNFYDLKDEYNEVFHTSKSKFFHEQDCHVEEKLTRSSAEDSQCCGSSTSAYTVFKLTKHKCCNGKIRSLTSEECWRNLKILSKTQKNNCTK